MSKTTVHVLSVKKLRENLKTFNKRTNLSVKESSILFERYWRIHFEEQTLKKLIGENELWRNMRRVKIIN